MASTVAKILWENVFIHYGFCRVLHSDQGRDFEAKLIKELCKMDKYKENSLLTISPPWKLPSGEIQQNTIEYAGYIIGRSEEELEEVCTRN